MKPVQVMLITFFSFAVIGGGMTWGHKGAGIVLMVLSVIGLCTTPLLADIWEDYD